MANYINRKEYIEKVYFPVKVVNLNRNRGQLSLGGTSFPVTFVKPYSKIPQKNTNQYFLYLTKFTKSNKPKATKPPTIFSRPVATEWYIA